MIGKITSGQSFLCALNYITAVREKDISEGKTATLLCHSEGLFPSDNLTMAACLEAYSRKGGHQLKSPLKHISLSFSPHDAERMRDDRFMEQIAREYMDMMGIKDTEFVIFRHHDHAHPHCHLVYSRVDRNGKVIKDSNDRKRNVKVCKELTEKYQLYVSKGKLEVNVERLHGQDLRRYEAAMLALKCFSEAEDWKDYENQLRDNNIKLRFCINNVTGKLQGVSYIYQSKSFSGKKLDNALTLSSLTAKFGSLPDLTRSSVKYHYESTRERLLDLNLGDYHATDNIERAFPDFEKSYPADKCEVDSLTDLLPRYKDFGNMLFSNDRSPSVVRDDSFVTLNLLVTLLLQPYGAAVSSGGCGTSSDLGWRDNDDERNQFRFRFRPMKFTPSISRPKGFRR